MNKKMRNRIISFFLAAMATCGVCSAQGSVNVYQPNTMNDLLAKKSSNQILTGEDAIVVGGFRVQLYSSNNAYKAKKDALSLEKELNNLYPGQHVYVTYAAPFWKVRIGDFTSYFEALTFSKKLKTAFPQYSNEIYIIKEDVVSVSYY